MPRATIELQDRDTALLCGLFECRVMTQNHATTLYFDERSEACKKRLQKLKAAGFISERPRRAFEPSVLFLTRKGLEVLQQAGLLSRYPPFDLPVLERRARVSGQTIRHELEVMDVKTALHSAIAKMSMLKIEEFSTWPLLNEFTACRDGYAGGDVLVKPDGLPLSFPTMPLLVSSFWIAVSEYSPVANCSRIRFTFGNDFGSGSIVRSLGSLK